MPKPTETTEPEDGDDLVIGPRIRIPLAEFEFTYVRSSGPGGQNVNKVATKARMRWAFAASPSLPDDVRERFSATYGSRITNDGDLILTSQRFRSQEKNSRDCLEKLREMLVAVATPPRRRRRTKPSRGAVQRRLNEKKRRSERKQSRRPPRDE